ncbi:hypothetical protein [Archangium lipolyticum]|uniref:hypothetical protein n=1 Tax=Archangium lipolyticum TaxID=2970465 RepID=UPI00214A039F|nr:hypothetical protein [Archangium lipolyticum]
MKQMDLPGLERLLEVCQRLKRTLLTTPPGGSPPLAGTRILGHPLDPMLAAFYARFGKAMFAADVAGMGLFQLDDTVNHLEAQNRQWQSDYQEQLPVPLFVFGGEPGMAYYYATVPGLADAEGRQPVVRVDPYEDPFALPIASDVDHLFDSYSRYLETLMAHPDYADYGSAALTFPRGIPDILARDERLVRLLRSGRFDPVLTNDDCREWAAQLTGSPGH